MQKETKKHGASFLLKLFTSGLIVFAVGSIYLENLVSYIKNFSTADHLEQRKSEESSKLVDEIDDISELADILIDEDNSNVTDIFGKIDKYREYLWNFEQLAYKFSNHILFSNELSYLEKYSAFYTPEIKNHLALFKRYNEKFSDKVVAEYNEVTGDYGLLGKVVDRMVDIKKKNPNYSEMLEMNKKLEVPLRELSRYFYSTEFLKRYFEYE